MSGPTPNPLPMLKHVRVPDLEPIALGSTFLATGGGGDMYMGRLLAEVAMQTHGQIDVMQPAALTDDDFTIVLAGLGAPTVLLEKPFNLFQLEQAVATVEERVGRTITAILAAEMGGANSLIPIAFAARRGVPMLDADGMGRAFPELQMVMFHVEGNPVCPMAIISEYGECALLENIPSPARAEAMARPICVVMGAISIFAGFPMDGEAARRSVVPGTLSLAHAIGQSILEGRRAGDPFAALLACLSRSPYYQHNARLGSGMIVDVTRRVERGWTIGVCRIQTIAKEELEIVFRNEYLVARRDGNTLVTVPDLITVLDAETAEPLTTDDIKYGQRVVVVATSAPACMRTPKALAIFGPEKFGLDETFVALEQRLSL